MSLVRLLALAVILLCQGGCELVKHATVSTPPPPAPRAYHAYTPTPDAAGVSAGIGMRRVAFLPLYVESVSPESLRDVEHAFASELTKEGYFEVVPISRTELEAMMGERQLASVRNLPDNLLASIRQKFGADGVLFVDLTHYSPYRPVSIGVRAKLVDVSGGRILWALDHVYDAGNPAVANAAKLFQQQYANDQRALPDDGGSVLLSPARFARYVAAETFATLRSTPAPTTASSSRSR